MRRKAFSGRPATGRRGGGHSGMRRSEEEDEDRVGHAAPRADEAPRTDEDNGSGPPGRTPARWRGRGTPQQRRCSNDRE